MAGSFSKVSIKYMLEKGWVVSSVVHYFQILRDGFHLIGNVVVFFNRIIIWFTCLVLGSPELNLHLIRDPFS